MLSFSITPSSPSYWGCLKKNCLVLFYSNRTITSVGQFQMLIKIYIFLFSDFYPCISLSFLWSFFWSGGMICLLFISSSKEWIDQGTVERMSALHYSVCERWNVPEVSEAEFLFSVSRIKQLTQSGSRSQNLGDAGQRKQLGMFVFFLGHVLQCGFTRSMIDPCEVMLMLITITDPRY